MLGFALIWHIWWMATVGLLGALAVGLAQAWRTHNEDEISANDIAAVERALTGKETTA